MANKQISDFTLKSPPADDDEFELQETGSGPSKKGTLVDAIQNAHGLSDGIVKVASGTMDTADEGVDYYLPGGTDVAVSDGGTGASDSTTARSNLQAAASGTNTDINSVTLSQTGLKIKGATSNTLTVKPNETLSSNRTLNIITGDASRTITLTGDTSLSGTNTGDQTNISGNAATVTTNANLTGDVTSSGNATTLAAGSASNLNSGTLAAGRLPALTGDVTTSAGSAATTIANDAVTYAKIQNVTGTDKVLGRSSSGAGDVEEIGTTGSGNVVRATSATLVTPILGTPTSGTLSTCTGLPISTGVSGLGTGVATFLTTPSSANLATALTDETGSGAAVFGTSPTIVTPTIADLTNMTHTHQSTAGGGTLDAAAIAAGTVATARLGSGTANSTTYLRGDQTWQKRQTANLFTKGAANWSSNPNTPTSIFLSGSGYTFAAAELAQGDMWFAEVHFGYTNNSGATRTLTILATLAGNTVFNYTSAALAASANPHTIQLRFAMYVDTTTLTRYGVTSQITQAGGGIANENAGISNNVITTNVTSTTNAFEILVNSSAVTATQTFIPQVVSIYKIPNN